MTLIKAHLLNEEVDGHEDESWDNNDNKDQENGKALRDGFLDDGGILVYLYPMNGGWDLMDGSSFHGGYLMDAAKFDCAQVYDGYQTLRDRPLFGGYHVNLKNCSDGNSSGYSKLDPSSISPSSSSNDDSPACISSVIGSPQGVGASLFPDQSLIYGLILDGSHGNLENHGDGNSNGS